MAVSKQHVVSELRRELSMRRRIYPKWVQEGKLEQWKADHQIECLEAAIKFIDPPSPQLF